MKIIARFVGPVFAFKWTFLVNEIVNIDTFASGQSNIARFQYTTKRSRKNGADCKAERQNAQILDQIEVEHDLSHQTRTLLLSQATSLLHYR